MAGFRPWPGLRRHADPAADPPPAPSKAVAASTGRPSDHHERAADDGGDEERPLGHGPSEVSRVCVSRALRGTAPDPTGGRCAVAS